MYKQLFFALLVFITQNGTAQLRWTGEGHDGEWNNALNWLPGRVPAAADTIVLDNSILAGNYTVQLPAGNVAIAVQFLFIQPTQGNEIKFINPATNTSSAAFVATGVGDAVVLDQGAIFINASGASSGTPVTVTGNGFFRINNGAHYIHRTERGHSTNLVSRLSTAPGTERGIFEFDVPSTNAYTVSISNRNYGTLFFSSSAAGQRKTYTGSGTGPVQVKGDLRVNGQAVFTYGANTNTITIDGSCSIGPNATFTIANGANPSRIVLRGDLYNAGIMNRSGNGNAARFELAGSREQTVTHTGSINGAVILAVQNTAGIRLATLLRVNYALEFISGKIYTTYEYPLQVSPGCLVTGASPLSFVEGPVCKIGAEAFRFPIGQGGIFAPLAIQAGINETDTFTARYHRSNPYSISGLPNQLDPSIDHISHVEYWHVQSNQAAGARILQLPVSAYSFAYQMTSLLVARHTGDRWQSEGADQVEAGVSQPPYVTGLISSNQALSNYGYFTLGTTDPVSHNPLPVRIADFNLVTSAAGRPKLEWVIADMPAVDWEIVIEKAMASTHYRTVKSIKGSEYFLRHWLLDTVTHSPAKYRMHIRTADTILAYSPERYWNPVSTSVSVPPLRELSGNLIQLSLPASYQQVELNVCDALGRVLLHKQWQRQDAGIRLNLDTQGWGNGLYIINARIDGAYRMTWKYIRR